MPGLHSSQFEAAIQFRFQQCFNLRRKNGGVPNAAVYACYAGRDGKKAKSMLTVFRKAKDPEWCENSDRLTGLSPDTKITFVILDNTSSPLLRRPAKLALSKAYTLQELLKLQEDVVAHGNGVAVNTPFAVPLTFRDDPSAQAQASLVLSLTRFQSGKDQSELLAQVQSDWKAKQRKERDDELAKLSKELKLLSADIPRSASSKDYVDMASGLFASIIPLFHSDFTDDSARVTDLIASYRATLSRIRHITDNLYEDTSIHLYGKVCLEISNSVRFLEKCLRKPALLNVNQIDNELRAAKARFEEYPQTTGHVLGSRDLVFQERATLLTILIDSRPTLRVNLLPDLSVDPAKLPLSLASRHSSATVQAISSWALLSSFAEIKRLLWLTGPDGCGKTRLTTSLVDAFGRVGVPTVYFTFNNHSDEKSSSEPPSLACMARTIAFQMAAYVDGLAGLVSSAVKDAGDLDALTFSEVFDKLIVGPLKAIPEKKVEGKEDYEVHAIFRRPEPVVIVLDDVDQCTPAQLDELILVLEDALPKLPKEARVMLCSRELAELRSAFATNARVSIVEFIAAPAEDTGKTSANRHSASSSQSSASSSASSGSGMWAGAASSSGLSTGMTSPRSTLSPSRSSSIKWAADQAQAEGSAAGGSGSGGTGSRRGSVSDKGKGSAARPCSGSLEGIRESRGILEVRR